MDQGLGRTAAAAAVRGVSTCGAARTLGRTAPSPQAPVSPRSQTHVGRGRGLGGRGPGWPGPGPRAGVRSPPSSPAGPAASAPTPRATENRPRFPPSRLGPGARRRGPASARTPTPLSRARGALLGEGLLLVPAKAKVSFLFGVGDVGRRVSGLTEILRGRFAPAPPPWLPWGPTEEAPPGRACPDPGPAPAGVLEPRPGPTAPEGRSGLRRRRGSGPGRYGWGRARSGGRCEADTCPPLGPALTSPRPSSGKGLSFSSLNEISPRKQRQEGSPLSVRCMLCLLHLSIWCCSVHGEGF